MIDVFGRDLDQPAEFRILQLARLKKFSWRVNLKYRLIRYATDCMLLAVLPVMAGGLAALLP